MGSELSKYLKFQHTKMRIYINYLVNQLFNLAL